MSYKNNKSEISASAWNKQFDLPDGCMKYSRLFGIYLKQNKRVTATDNPSIMI